MEQIFIDAKIYAEIDDFSIAPYEKLLKYNKYIRNHGKDRQSN